MLFGRKAIKNSIFNEKVKPEFMQRYLGCSDEIQSVVRFMFAVLESPDVIDEDRKRALQTIADAFAFEPRKRTWDGHDFTPKRYTKGLNVFSAKSSRQI